MTTRELLRDLNAQRRVVAWYQYRAKQVDVLASLAATGGLDEMQEDCRMAAAILRIAARREAEPGRGS